MKKLICYLPVLLMVFAFTSCEANQDDLMNTDATLKNLVITPPECTDETAWANGPRYVMRGNWATYTPLPDPLSTDVSIYAGQNMLAGTVHFTNKDMNGNVMDGFYRLKFFFYGCWKLQDVEEAIKIQGYEMVPPAKNPVPGKFETYKGNGTVYSAVDSNGMPYGYLYVIVPAYAYYGIHLDLTNCCD